jgi:hypothetical protein
MFLYMLFCLQAAFLPRQEAIEVEYRKAFTILNYNSSSEAPTDHLNCTDMFLPNIFLIIKRRKNAYPARIFLARFTCCFNKSLVLYSPSAFCKMKNQINWYPRSNIRMINENTCATYEF